MSSRAILIATLAIVVLFSLLYTVSRVQNIDAFPNYFSFPMTVASSPYAAPEVRYSIPPKSPNGRRVLITGGAGFIGSQLGYFLHQRGFEVILIDNMEFGYEDNLVVDGEAFGTFVKGDVRDVNVRPFFANVDAVFHFAALSALPVCQVNPQRATEVNVGGVAAVLEASRLAGVRRFLFASTSAVYEENTEPVLTEDLSVSPHLLYSLGKYQAEMLTTAMAKSYGLDVVILRFFNVFGPHQDFRRKSPPFTSYIVRELLHNRVPILHSDGKQRRDYVYVTDLIELALLAMDKPEARGQVFNVASGVAYSVNEMYDMVATMVRSKIRPVYKPAANFWSAYPEMFAGSRPIDKAILEKEVNKVVLGSNEKAKKLLGWTPKVTMQQGLQTMVDYVKKVNLNGVSFDTAWDEAKSGVPAAAAAGATKGSSPAGDDAGNH